MTQTDIEIRLREALVELTGTTPLENPVRPRAVGGERPRPPRTEVKVLTTVGCAVLVAVALGFGAFHLASGPSRIGPAHASTTGPPTDVSVPDVVGQELPPALTVLQAAGLQSRFSSVASSQPNGSIVHQSPAPGTEVKRSATVVLEVAGGGGSSGTTVTVPNVLGDSLPVAEAELRSVGLDPITPVPTGGTTSPGTVTGQVPGAGSVVPAGSTVTVQATAY
jgi:PASTA domain